MTPPLLHSTQRKTTLYDTLSSIYLSLILLQNSLFHLPLNHLLFPLTFPSIIHHPPYLYQDPLPAPKSMPSPHLPFPSTQRDTTLYDPPPHLITWPSFSSTSPCSTSSSITSPAPRIDVSWVTTVSSSVTIPSSVSTPSWVISVPADRPCCLMMLVSAILPASGRRRNLGYCKSIIIGMYNIWQKLIFQQVIKGFN